MTCPGILTFLPPTPQDSPPPRTHGGGVGQTFVMDFLDSSWNFPDFWFFDPDPPFTHKTPNPGGVGWELIFVITFSAVHEISRTF